MQERGPRDREGNGSSHCCCEEEEEGKEEGEEKEEEEELRCFQVAETWAVVCGQAGGMAQL